MHMFSIYNTYSLLERQGVYLIKTVCIHRKKTYTRLAMMLLSQFCQERHINYFLIAFTIYTYIYHMYSRSNIISRSMETPFNKTILLILSGRKQTL